jgi:hypothetical protein
MLFAAILLSAVSAKAQSPLSFGYMNSLQAPFRDFNQPGDTSKHRQKWFVTKSASISTGFVAFKGGSGSFLSASLGLQLNRQLTNNLYAFAGVYVVPSVFHYNNAFQQPGVNKNNSFMNANNVGVYPTAQMGLMYISNDKTFSISGSIGVSRSSYNSYSPFYIPDNSSVLRK